jgi:hypothetical protein
MSPISSKVYRCGIFPSFSSPGSRCKKKFPLVIQDVLDTPEKLDLLRPLRHLIVVRGGVRTLFDQLAPYHRMLTPLSAAEVLHLLDEKEPSSAKTSPQRFIDPEAGTALGAPRDITITRGDRKIGVTLRGGREMRLGLYIAAVQSKSPAAVAGLVPGDRVLAINDTKFVLLLVCVRWFFCNLRGSLQCNWCYSRSRGRAS